MKLSFIKRIDTIKNSIFYSLIKFNNEIIAFGRRHYTSERVIKKIALNENFDVIEDNNFIDTKVDVVNTCLEKIHKIKSTIKLANQDTNTKEI